MRLAAVLLSALGGLIGLRFTVPVIPAMFAGELGGDARFAPLLIVALLAISGANLALRRSPLAWRPPGGGCDRNADRTRLVLLHRGRASPPPGGRRLAG